MKHEILVDRITDLNTSHVSRLEVIGRGHYYSDWNVCDVRITADGHNGYVISFDNLVREEPVSYDFQLENLLEDDDMTGWWAPKGVVPFRITGKVEKDFVMRNPKAYLQDGGRTLKLFGEIHGH